MIAIMMAGTLVLGTSVFAFAEDPTAYAKSVIEDSKKAFYYRGLAEWEKEKGYLIDTCLDGQDTFKRLLVMFDIDFWSK